MRGWKRAGGAIWILVGTLALALASTGCHRVELPDSGATLYSSPQTNPLVVSEDGKFLLVANTTSHTVSVYDTRRLVLWGQVRPRWAHLADIHVGHDPVGIAVEEAE